MGVFAFLLGAAFGVYMAQNYRVPEARSLCRIAKQYKELHRRKLQELEDPANVAAAPARGEMAEEYITPPHLSHLPPHFHSQKEVHPLPGRIATSPIPIMLSAVQMRPESY